MEAGLINYEIAKEVAEELVNVKKTIYQLLAKEKELKEQIKPYLMENKELFIGANRVYYQEANGARKFIRTEVIEYIKEIWGDDFANQVDNDCTRVGNPTKIVYVSIKKINS